MFVGSPDLYLYLLIAAFATKMQKSFNVFCSEAYQMS